MIFEEIYSIISKRKKDLAPGSYCASLFKEGEDKILQKIGEEAAEVIIAGKNNNRQRIIEEISDLHYMVLVFLVYKNITLKDIYLELEKRRK